MKAPGFLSSRILRNSFWNVVSYSVGIVVLLVTTPLYIRLLGLDRFGVFTLLATVVAPLGMIQSGVGQAVTKFVAEFNSSRELDRVSRLVATTFSLNIAVGLVGFLVLWFAADYAAHRFFRIPLELASEARLSFRLVGAVWLLTQIAHPFQAVISGLEDFKTVAIGNALQQGLTYGGGCVVLLFSPRVTSLIWWNLSVTMGLAVFWMVSARRQLRSVNCLPGWDSASARLSLGFSSWQILSNLQATVANHADRILLGAFTGTSALGLFGVASAVQTRGVGLVWSVLVTLFPAASALCRSEGQSERFILESGWLISMAAGMFYAVLFVLGPDLLRIWLGDIIGSQAGPVLRILLLTAMAGMPSAIIYQYLLGTGRTKAGTLGNLLTTVATLASTFILVRQYGLNGAAWGGFLGLVLTRPLFHFWIFRNYFRTTHSSLKCFHMLYANIGSLAVATATACLCHGLWVKIIGSRMGLIVSVILTPVIVFGLGIALEYTVVQQRYIIGKLRRNLWQNYRASAR